MTTHTIRRTIRQSLAVLAFVGLVLTGLSVDSPSSPHVGPTGHRVGSAQHDSRPGLPPYWHRVAPSWCAEDQPCWIGSDADGRSDRASLADWQHQLKIGTDDLRVVWVFAGRKVTDGEPLAVDRRTVYGVHACHREGRQTVCRARVHGLKRTVFVTRASLRSRSQ